MPSKFKKAIGAVKDQTSIRLAKVASNNSSNLEVAVLKATTHDDVPIDERYVVEILRLVSSSKSHAAACARAMGKRIGRTRNWIVAAKSLMLVLRIFQDGDPYFPREVLHAMKRGAKILNLSTFRDDSNSSPWDYTAFVRTFALYLDERLDCFLTGKLQSRFNHHQDDKEPFHRRSRQEKESVRDIKPAMLIDKISSWQRLLDKVVATRPTGSAKTNRLVQISLYAVVQESFELYKDISDGLALLLDSFFHLQYNSCVNAFQACIKVTKQFQELSDFYDFCKSIGVGRTSEYPSVQKISEELIETLQEFLKDQSSFPTTGPSPNQPQLLLPAPSIADGSVSGRRQDSYGQYSEFSEAASEMYSEFGSQSASLEDLISATELTKRSRSISIDLETYSIGDQFEKHERQDDSFSANDDEGSSRSLPVSSSIVDLLVFDEMPQREKDQEEEKEEASLDQPSLATNWDNVLAETNSTATTQPFDNGFDPFSNLVQEHKPSSESGSREAWEFVLGETTTPPPPTQTRPNTEDFNDNVSSIDSSFLQSSSMPMPSSSEQYYNPFLHDDSTELATVATVPTSAAAGVQGNCPAKDDIFQAPAFEATPTFCAQNPNGMSLVVQNENDPFASYTIVGGDQQGSIGSVNQQNLLHEQQLWLQQQNKIIARQTANGLIHDA